jgi:hypothetical protein
MRQFLHIALTIFLKLQLSRLSLYFQFRGVSAPSFCSEIPRARLRLLHWVREKEVTGEEERPNCPIIWPDKLLRVIRSTIDMALWLVPSEAAIPD